MSIIRTHHCGHVQYKCPHCQSLGCGNSRCVESIGNNSSIVCKVCGSTSVLPMEVFQTRQKHEAMKQARIAHENELRLKNLEKASNIQYNSAYTNSYNVEPISITNFIKLTFVSIVLMAICFGVSTQFQYPDYTGIIAFIVGVINVIGGIGAILYTMVIYLLTCM